jgi:hypothetical protein
MTAEEFSQLLDDEAGQEFDSGRVNNISDLTLSIAAILASFIAAVLAATGVTSWVTAIVAGLPGMCTSLQRIVDFRGRAAWYFVCAARRRAFSRSLAYEGMPVKDVSQRLSEFEIDMEARWSRMLVPKSDTARSTEPAPAAPDA